MTLAALLAATAVAVLLLPYDGRQRLGSLLPGPVAPPAPRGRRRHVAVLVAAGVGVAVALHDVLGVVLGAAVALGGPRLLDRLDHEEDDDSEEVALALPLALDLLAACLSGGATVQAAVGAVRDAVPGPCGLRFGRVAASLLVGAPEDEAFRALGDGRDAAGSAARALVRAAQSGIPVARAVARVASEARRTAAADAERRAARAGVKVVGPLGACFLPAFVLIGVVPTVMGVAGPLVHSL